MSIRVGRSWRTRHGGRVWVTMPAWLVLLAVVLFLPILIDYWALRLLVWVAAWAVNEVWRMRRGH